MIKRRLDDVLEESSLAFSQSLSYSYDQEDDDPGRYATAETSTTSSVPSDFPSLAPSFGSIGGTNSEMTPTPVLSFPVTSPPTLPPVSSAVSDTSGGASSPTALPTVNDSVVETVAFECSDTTGVIVTSELTSDSISIFLLVGYLAESKSPVWEDFVDQLERELVASAIRAALPCSNEPVSGAFVPANLVFGRTLMAQTVNVGSCAASLPEAEGCFILETELIFFLNEEVNVDQASFDSYTTIEAEMNNNTFVDRGDIPSVVKLEYFGPSNLVPPPPRKGSGDGQSGETTQGNPSESSIIATREESPDAPTSLSSWTIGASAAAIMGGMLSIAAWSRSRRSLRQRRHLRLLDDVARGPTDGYQGAGQSL